MPEGFLAALIAPGGTTKRFGSMPDCVEGAVGLCPQAASSAMTERRSNDFIRGSSRRSGLTSCLDSALAVNARAGEAHLKGHRRNRHSAIRPRHIYVHRLRTVAAARDGRYTLTRVAPPPPRDSARHHRRTLPCRSPARDATGSRAESRGCGRCAPGICSA